MSCDLLKGRKTYCKTVGGLKDVYFVNFGGIPEANVTYDANGQTITTISGVPDAFKYELHLGNDLTQNINSDPKNGTTFIEQVLSLTLKVLTGTDNIEILKMAYNRLHIIIEDQMDNRWIVGLINGADVTGGTAVTGAEMADLNGYTLVFTGNEKVFANEYTGDLTTEFNIVVGA